MSTRQLGLGMATALVVGNTIGMGIFHAAGGSSHRSGMNALSGWAVVIVGCVCPGCHSSRPRRASSRKPTGPFGYVRQTLGEAVAFRRSGATGFPCWVTNAVLATGVVGYFRTVFPAAARKSRRPCWPSSFMWIFVGVNCSASEAAAACRSCTSLLKLVPLGAGAGGRQRVHHSKPWNYTPNLPTTPITMQMSIGAAAGRALRDARLRVRGRCRRPRDKSEKDDPARDADRHAHRGRIYVAIVAIGMLVVPQATLATSDRTFVTIVGPPARSRQRPLDLAVRRDQRAGCLNGWTLLASELTAHARRAPAVAGDPRPRQPLRRALGLADHDRARSRRPLAS
jgi:APA family basic amino acid/polyamine antiporter